MPAGRPTDYRTEYAEQARKLCRLGATDAELADFFEVSVKTIYNWRNTQEEFLQALHAGKDAADNRVERSLYQRAVGYEFDAVKIFMPAGADNPVYAPYREHVPPEFGSMKLWLCNRRGEEWRDKIDHSLSGPNGGPIQGEIVYRIIDPAKDGAK